MFLLIFFLISFPSIILSQDPNECTNNILIFINNFNGTLTLNKHKKQTTDFFEKKVHLNKYDLFYKIIGLDGVGMQNYEKYSISTNPNQSLSTVKQKLKQQIEMNLKLIKINNNPSEMDIFSLIDEAERIPNQSNNNFSNLLFLFSDLNLHVLDPNMTSQYLDLYENGRNTNLFYFHNYLKLKKLKKTILKDGDAMLNFEYVETKTKLTCPFRHESVEVVVGKKNDLEQSELGLYCKNECDRGYGRLKKEYCSEEKFKDSFMTECLKKKMMNSVGTIIIIIIMTLIYFSTIGKIIYDLYFRKIFSEEYDFTNFLLNVENQNEE